MRHAIQFFFSFCTLLHIFYELGRICIKIIRVKKLVSIRDGAKFLGHTIFFLFFSFSLVLFYCNVMKLIRRSFASAKNENFIKISSNFSFCVIRSIFKIELSLEKKKNFLIKNIILFYFQTLSGVSSIEKK